MQFKIGNKHYSVMAAYFTRGFRHWKIKEGSCTGETFQVFWEEMRNSNLVGDDEYLIFDICGIHKSRSFPG